MKKTLIALVLANLALVGCGSDDDNNEIVDPGPGPGPDPVETVTIGEAETIVPDGWTIDGDAGVITFTLATEEGVAITGLKADESAVTSIKYVGLQAAKEWTHYVDKMGLPGHELQSFGCNADDCTIQIEEDPDKPGSYELTPATFDWGTTPASVKAVLTLSTEKVTLDPIWIESGS